MSRAILLLLAAVALQGCTSFELVRMRNDIARSIPDAQIGPGYAGAVGPLTMGTARSTLRLAAGEDVALANLVLASVRRVQVGGYAVRGSVDATAAGLPRILDRYQAKGWENVVVVRDEETFVWVLVRERRQSLRDLLVVALTDENLVLTRLSGDFTGALARAIAEYDRTQDAEKAKPPAGRP